MMKHFGQKERGEEGNELRGKRTAKNGTGQEEDSHEEGIAEEVAERRGKGADWNGEDSERSEGLWAGARRNGKVARLPKAVRDRINLMIQDGISYRKIIEGLGEEGKELDTTNLSRWKDGGYKDWLAEQAFIERTRARQETPGELVRDFDATEVNHAALQLGTLHIFEALRDLGPGSLNQKLGGDCAAFARLINALARASRETMQLQRYRDVCARARRMLDQLKDPKRKLTDDERRSIVLEVDDILGLGGEPELAQLQSPPADVQSPAILRSSAPAGDGMSNAQIENEGSVISDSVPSESAPFTATGS